MVEQFCDFSPLKLELKARLRKLVDNIECTIAGLDTDERCLLNEFGQIREEMSSAEMLAATFYLRCYLSTYTDKYTEISQSVRKLSQRRHGALIVVQREHPLEGFITPGVPIDAALSSALLESVFVPGGPLHDGAVLIIQNKIASATNVLPLTTLVTDEKLGTRHRAAIGLTERSDALVIVVSEETGKASFSLNGNLYGFAVG